MTATNQPHAGQAIPGLLNDIVTTFVFRSDFLPDTRDLARLRAVSCAMRDAVDATGREVKELNALEAAEIGCISVLERLHQNGLLSTPEITHVPFPASINVPDVGQLYRVTARSGQLEVLKWLRAKSLWWPHRVEGWHFHAFLGAAEGGNIEIIKWLLASGQQWDAAVCAIAAQFGQARGAEMASHKRLPVGQGDVRGRGARRPLRDIEVGARKRLPVGRANVLARGRGRPPGDAEMGAHERLPVGLSHDFFRATA